MLLCFLPVKGRRDYYDQRKFHKGDGTSPWTREQADWQQREGTPQMNSWIYGGWKASHLKHLILSGKYTVPQSCFSFCVERTEFPNILTSLSPFTHCASGDIVKAVVWPSGATSLLYLSFHSDLRWRIQELLIRSPQRPLSLWASLKLDFSSDLFLLLSLLAI